MPFASSFCLKLPYPIPKYPPTTGFRQGSDINLKKLRNHVISKSNMALFKVRALFSQSQGHSGTSHFLYLQNTKTVCKTACVYYRHIQIN